MATGATTAASGRSTPRWRRCVAGARARHAAEVGVEWRVRCTWHGSWSVHSSKWKQHLKGATATAAQRASQKKRTLFRGKLS
eukprot:364502-Chlamydomonas_euryale.AAC.18